MSRLVSAGLALLAAGLAMVGPSRAAEAPSALAVRLDALAAAEFAKQPTGALSLAVVKNGALIWSAHYGAADIATGAPPTNDTVYRVGSITKQFTALMLLQLVEAGTVRLSDPVAKYLPEIDQVQGRYPDAPPITLMQLATHTAGLAVEADNAVTTAVGPSRDWEAQLLAALPHTRYASEPGVRYAYSNIDYAVLGAALSRAAGVPYVDYVRRHILEPLGMTATTFAPDPVSPLLARGYVLQAGLPDGALPDKELAGRGYRVPGGGAFSTLTDLAKFNAFEMGDGPETVLKRQTLEASRTLLVIADADLRGGYGVGFQLFPGDGFVMQGHLGGIAGYRALDAVDPKTATGVVILRNMSGDAIDLLALGAAIVKEARQSEPGPIPAI